ncbi:MAG: hypothetical protein H7A45_10915 [Verrucomicrobiales bacterium]|nr:hypothetical protein [Verrucomicrobiales bacterium]
MKRNYLTVALVAGGLGWITLNAQPGPGRGRPLADNDEQMGPGQGPPPWAMRGGMGPRWQSDAQPDADINGPGFGRGGRGPGRFNQLPAEDQAGLEAPDAGQPLNDLPPGRRMGWGPGARGQGRAAAQSQRALQGAQQSDIDQPQRGPRANRGTAWQGRGQGRGQGPAGLGRGRGLRAQGGPAMAGPQQWGPPWAGRAGMAPWARGQAGPMVQTPFRPWLQGQRGLMGPQWGAQRGRANGFGPQAGRWGRPGWMAGPGSMAQGARGMRGFGLGRGPAAGMDMAPQGAGRGGRGFGAPWGMRRGMAPSADLPEAGAGTQGRPRLRQRGDVEEGPALAAPRRPRLQGGDRQEADFAPRRGRPEMNAAPGEAPNPPRRERPVTPREQERGEDRPAAPVSE